MIANGFGDRRGLRLSGQHRQFGCQLLCFRVSDIECHVHMYSIRTTRIATVRHAAASGTLSRDSRPYPHNRYALPLRLICHWKPASPQFRGRLTPEVGDDMEGGKSPALTGVDRHIPKRNLPRLTSSFHGQKLDQQPGSIPPIAGDRGGPEEGRRRAQARAPGVLARASGPGGAQRLGPESRSGPPCSGPWCCGLSDGNREGTRG